MMNDAIRKTVKLKDTIKLMDKVGAFKKEIVAKVFVDAFSGVTGIGQEASKEISQIYLNSEAFANHEIKVASIYSKYFTHDEIKELTAFYETPLGKKVIKSNPNIAMECFDAGKELGEEINETMKPELEGIMDKYGY